MNSLHKTALVLLVTAGLSGAALAETIESPLPGPGSFSTIIDNSYWPLPLGSSFSYMAETEDGCEYNKLTVTTATKIVTVDGQHYTTAIIRDQAWESEECDIATATFVEDTNDFYAMDVVTSNIWYFGEDTLSIDEESEDCSDEGAWEAGVNGATPGVVMLGDPQSGYRYQQEFDEDNAEDWASVLRLNASVSIELGDYDDCLVTREWTPLAPGEVEHKYYCPETNDPGPGLVFIEELQGRTVYVEYIGEGLILGAPGEFTAYPALEAVGSCNIP